MELVHTGSKVTARSNVSTYYYYYFLIETFFYSFDCRTEGDVTGSCSGSYSPVIWSSKMSVVDPSIGKGFWLKQLNQNNFKCRIFKDLLTGDD